MKKKKQNRFAYSDDSGLKVLSQKEYLDVFDKKDTQKSEQSDIEKSDELKGGLADKLSIEQIAEKHKVPLEKIMKQVKKGLKVEMGHTDDKNIALEIVKDHLYESSSYYSLLREMEKKFKES
jgi:hypothetical protein